MTAQEKMLPREKGVPGVIDLPSTPICISKEPANLQGSFIEIHYLNNELKTGMLQSVDMTEQLISFESSRTNRMVRVRFELIRFMLFTTELSFELVNNPIRFQSRAIDVPDKPQPYELQCKDGQKLKGVSAVTIIDDIALHIYKVKEDNRAHRIFVPMQILDDYVIGPQIGSMLEERDAVSHADVESGLEEQRQSRERPLGEYLTESGIVSEEALKDVLKQQQMQSGDWPRVRLGELLINEGLISETELEEALKLQKQDRARKLGDILIDIGATSEDAVHGALSHKLGVPYVKLKDFDIDVELLELVPVNIARDHNVFPLMMCDGKLVVAVSDPTHMEATKILSFVTNHPIEVAVAAPSEIAWAIDHHYGDSMDENADMMEAEFNPVMETVVDDELEKLANEKPIVRLVQNLLLESIKRNASDIHIRPLSKGVQVLFRIHGKLTHVKNFGKSLLPAIVSRIKVIARMDVAQRRLPQDGRVQINLAEQTKDMRVSTIPTVEGESVVIRLLASAATLKPVDELGFTDRDTSTFSELLKRGAGMILVTGPTGSGKSTTLYSALNVLREMNVNIITAEDPVEIRLDGLEQVQIMHEIGMDFGRVLRNILRHDPDVIMVGEIRDEETARIAIKAAQTGHLVLSTLHTNSAADTILRLREMNIESYMLSTALLGVVAQRLITRNCEHCLVEEEVSSATRQLLGVGGDEIFYMGKGCPRCSNTGISGRVPAYELLEVSSSIQSMILNEASTMELNDSARSWGMQSIMECALKYARNKQTPLAEVQRVYMS